MGTQITPDHLQGILIPEARIEFASLEDKGAGTTDSAYTQSDPVPGIPLVDKDEHTLILEASGEQEADGSIEIKTRRAGNPGEGSFVWRDLEAGEATDEYMGQDQYGLITGFNVLDVTAPTIEGMKVVKLQSNDLLAVGSHDGANTLYTYKYDVSTAAWTRSSVVVSGNTASEHEIIQLPNGRILWFRTTTSSFYPNGTGQIDVFYSDNDGTNWGIYATGILETPVHEVGAVAFIERLEVSYSNGVILLLTEYLIGSTNTFNQYASNDLGQTFSLVLYNYATEAGESISLITSAPLDNGGFIFGFEDVVPSDHDFYIGTIPSAYTPMTEVSKQIIDSTVPGVASGDVADSSPGMTIWRDDENDYWVAYTKRIVPDSAPFVQDYTQIWMQRSSDGGTTWNKQDSWSLMFESAVDTYFKEYEGVSINGKSFLIGAWYSPAASPDEVIPCIELGGYGRQTAPFGKPELTLIGTESWNEENSVTYGQQGFAPLTVTADARMWLPIEYPGSTAAGWVESAAGNELIDGATTGGMLRIQTTVGVHKSYSRTFSATSNTIDSAFCDWTMKTASGVLLREEVAVRIVVGRSGFFSYDASIRIKQNQFQVWDMNLAIPAPAGSTVAVDLTEYLKFRAHIREDNGTGKLRIWTCREGHDHEWELVFEHSLVDEGVGTTKDHSVTWGHIDTTPAATTRVSFWKHFGWTIWGGGWSPDEANQVPEPWANPTQLRGRKYGSGFQGVVDQLKIRAVTGPSALGDSQTIDTRYEYPIQNIFPRQIGSPNRVYRSVDDGSTLSFVFDLDSADSTTFMDNELIGIMLFNCNFKTAYLEQYNGATWDILVTLDASDGYDGLKFDRNGSRIIPNTGISTVGDKYFFYNDHVGDTIDLGTGTSSQRYRKITGNTEGAWVGNDSITKIPTLRFADVTGAEAGAGTGDIWRKDFGGLVYNRYSGNSLMRVRIPAQDNADGYFQIGTIVIGHVEVFGRQYDQGRSITSTNNLLVNTRPSGARSVYNKGPVSRIVDMAWVDTAIDTCPFFVDGPSPNYVVGELTNNEPIAAVDTAQQMAGIIDETGGGAVPVVYLPRIKVLADGAGDTALVNGRQELILGRLGESSKIDAVLGNELDNETVRLNTITFSEEV